ncbi:hypothetical protein QQ045_020374 [Rhodiola kirilowii]
MDMHLENHQVSKRTNRRDISNDTRSESVPKKKLCLEGNYKSADTNDDDDFEEPITSSQKVVAAEISKERGVRVQKDKGVKKVQREKNVRGP